MSIEFRASQDTHIKAFTSDLWSLAEEERVAFSADSLVKANLISEANGFYYVELVDHMPGNWRKLWYLVTKHWTKEQHLAAKDTEIVAAARAAEFPAPSTYERLIPTPPPIDAKAHGYVDLYSESSISGWAYYSGHTDAPMTVYFYFDGQLVGKTVADQLRPDVKRAGLETDRCGFNFTPPSGSFAKSEKIEVCASNGQVIRSRVVKPTLAAPAPTSPA